jgi:hypothetical protein
MKVFLIMNEACEILKAGILPALSIMLIPGHMLLSFPLMIPL